MVDEGGFVWECPAQDGTICADADDVLLIWADLDTSDWGTVAKTDVGQLTLIVGPDLKHTV